MAQEKLKQSARQYNIYYDCGARTRQLKVRNKVLVLLPTEQNKLLVRWKGPYEVVGVKYDYDYVVDVDSVKKTHHINLLKQYFTREVEEVTAGNCFDVCDGDVVDEEAWVDRITSDDYDEVVFSEVPNLPCPTQKEFVEDIKVNASLVKEKQEQVTRLLYENQDVFTITDVVKKTSVAECKIHLTSDDLVRSPPYRVPQALQGEIQKEEESIL